MINIIQWVQKEVLQTEKRTLAGIYKYAREKISKINLRKRGEKSFAPVPPILVKRSPIF